MTTHASGGWLGATFPDRTSAEKCSEDLKASGFDSPWLAVVAPEIGTLEHAVAETNDGPLGALSRYFSGRHSLRRLLIEHGLGESEAARLDEAATPSGAVIVVDAGERASVAQEIFRRGASRVVDHEGVTGARYPSTTATVPGQGDELDRGSGAASSGGGLGATTGFMSESGARKDMRANDIGEVEPN